VSETRRAVVQEVDQVVVLAQVVEKQSKALMVALPTTLMVAKQSKAHVFPPPAVLVVLTTLMVALPTTLAPSRLRRPEPIHSPVMVTMAQ
jgi:hypothetical protein